jgi:formylglycine-generating enzyme required for sulfatase activity
MILVIGLRSPTPDYCDFGHYNDFALRLMKDLPPNGYGLYGMSGGVWEWTQDWYDRDSYRNSPDHEPKGPSTGEQKVLRGGSWADCAEAISVSFRMSLPVGDEGDRCPMLGMRLCRRTTTS